MAQSERPVISISGDGGFGSRVTRTEDLQQALKDAISHKGPSLVEINTDPELI